MARIVAQTMHNYLMWGHLLQCRVVPREKLHPDTFKGCHLRNAVPRRERNRRKMSEWLESGNIDLIRSKLGEIEKKSKARLQAKTEKLKALGYDIPLEDLERKVSVKRFAEKTRTDEGLEDWEVEYAEELAAMSD